MLERERPHASLKKKHMSIDAKKKGMKENKLSYIRTVLSSGTIGTKV
jgi:hypothetical protein